MDVELRKLISNPDVSLRAYGTLVDQDTGDLVRFDPNRLTDKLQETVIGYVANTPRTDDGYMRWLDILKGRQSGCSTTGALAMYPLTVNPGFEGVIIADTQDRANGLFDRIMLNHLYWPEDVRPEQQSTNETRSFTTKDGSRVRVLSGHTEAVGIGRSIDFLLASEIAYWANASKQFSLIQPAMINRRNARVVKECTPAPLSEPSTEYWMESCHNSRLGLGRSLYHFSPFWDGKLNRRPWPKGAMPDKEELDLIDRYGPLGLTLNNLAFRREVMASDSEIRRNPDLFGVYYPFNDIDCWVGQGAGFINPAVLAKHSHNLLPETEGYTEFEPPAAGALYLIGVDPSGWGRDHASFQVLEIWADEWRQVASYGGVTDPNEFATILFDAGVRYNNAKIAIERNGVGAAPITLLRAAGYPNLHYDASLKPGLHKANHDAWTSILVDALLDKLVLRGEDTVLQLRGYRSDKLVERTVRADVLSQSKGRRRDRHHWDRVSALMVACVAALKMPVRHRPTVEATNVLAFSELSYRQTEAWRKKQAAAASAPQRRRAHYRRRKP